MTDLALYRQDCTNGSTWWVLDPTDNHQIFGDHAYGGCADIPLPPDGSRPAGAPCAR